MDKIRDGFLKVGYKMPTERELSEQLKISRNTVSMAYNELEHEGVLKSYQGKGTFVAEEAKSWEANNIVDKITKFVDLSLDEALESGLECSEFLEIVNSRVKEKMKLMKKMKAVYVECNMEQSKTFSRQLSSSTNMNVTSLTINDIKKMDNATKKIIEDCQVVVSTFNHINEVKECLRGCGKEVLGVAINADLETVVKIARYPKDTKFIFICISEEFMFKVRSAIDKAGLGNLDIKYSNSIDEKELIELINKVDVVIVSPGRYKQIEKINHGNKEIIEFIYRLDEDSVKALKPKLMELEYKK